jgi:hypothetical protein
LRSKDVLTPIGTRGREYKRALLALLVDIRNLKRKNEYKFVITNMKKKTRFDIANDSRFYSTDPQMIREYDSINLRLGLE